MVVEHAHSFSMINSTRIQCTHPNKQYLESCHMYFRRCKSQPRFHHHSFTRLTDPTSEHPETWSSGGSRHSKCLQPHFHALNVKATWDGEVIHAVDLDIRFGIDAIPSSRLRLISQGAATHAEITGGDENSPATTSTLAWPAFFLAQGVQKAEPSMDDKMQSVIADLKP